jgi:hypothetical protein
VLAAIKFNDQSGFQAYKIGDERSDRILPPEFEPGQAMCADVVPEYAFRIGLICAQTFRILAMLRVGGPFV